MARVKGNIQWWNQQLLELGVDQAASVSEPDHLVFGLSLIFTTFMDRLKAWFDETILPTNERLRWIKNDKLPQRLELRDCFHAFETEENRSEMLGYFMSMMHMLHISGIVTSQYSQAHRKERRPEGASTMRDRPPKLEALPVAFAELLTMSNEKVNKPMPSMSLPESPQLRN
jgi:hypothetical protein